MSELYEWLTAIGITVASMVAIIVALIPSILRWYNKPKFEIEFENKEPFCRFAFTRFTIVNKGRIAKVQSKTYWIRLRVRNVGKSLARGCEGKLIRITDAETHEDRQDFDPVVLKWVGTSRNPIDINKSEYEYLDILFTARDHNEQFHIATLEKEPRAINLHPERKDYVLHIVLYGENVEPLSKSFYLKNHKKYDKIELSSFKGTDVEKMVNRTKRTI